jgi:drug efflux transport system permease protein
MPTRLYHMLIKEFIQLFRDPKARFVVWGPPLISMLIFGYAATFELRHIPIAVLDFDNTYESREFLSRFRASPYFDVRYRLSDRRELRDLIDRSDVTLAIRVNAGFGRLIRRDKTAPVQVIVDGSNSNTALIALGYVSRIAADYTSDLERDRIARTSPALLASLPEVLLEQRPWYNPNLDSRWYFVPGLIGSILLISIVQLTAFAVVRERELGTLEQVMVTPITRLEFVLGKTVPFFIVGLGDAALITAVGTFWFGVPFRGNVLLILLGASLFLLSSLGIGLLISTAAKTQQQALVTGFFFLMPAITFSGFATPVSSMPAWLQEVVQINPLVHFLEVLRGVYLKGIGLDVLWPHMLAMSIIGVALLALTAARFRKSLD